jgi:hypothetical protein
VVRSRALIGLLCWTLVACIARTSSGQPQNIASGEFAGVDMTYASSHVLMRERRVGLGTICAVLNPGKDLRTTPPSYLAADIGKAGVPTPKARDLRMVRRIQRYVHSKTLRFAYAAGEFIVYDATDGPCTGSAPGYFVLNGACNESYMPSSESDSTIAVPGCLEAPRPWIPHDRGQGTSADWGTPNPAH